VHVSFDLLRIVFLSLTDSSCSGQLVVLQDEFYYFNTNLWDAHEFGSPDFNYTCGSWLGGASWLYVPVFDSGGSDPAYNGFHFVHTLDEPFEGEFTVVTELGWSAPSTSPAFQIEIRLLDASDDFIADGSWSIRLQCRDYWIASSCRPVASNEDYHVEGAFLPLEGSGKIRMTRNGDLRVEIYWDDSLMLSSTNPDIITQICLRVVGRFDFPGAAGGFNYLYAYASLTDSGGPIIIAPWGGPFVVLGIVVIIIQLTILIYLIAKKKRI
jgi:hypothetical protein